MKSCFSFRHSLRLDRGETQKGGTEEEVQYTGRGHDRDHGKVQSHAKRRVQPDWQPPDLLYLHNWPSPGCGAAVMVHVISSSLGVLPLLPSRGQARGGQGVSSRRGRLAKCGERAKQRKLINTAKYAH